MAKRKIEAPAAHEPAGVLDPTDDVEIDIPLHALISAPWNPKAPIHGVYRAGLAGSLDTFGFRDRLKVWPDPKHRGQYYILDGNQRSDVILELIEGEIFRLQVDREMAGKAVDEAEVARVVEKRAKALMPTKAEVEAGGDAAVPPTAGTLAALRDEVVAELTDALRKKLADEMAGDEAREAAIRSEANSRMIPCRVLAGMSLAEAKAFTAAFDRNHARYDEHKLVQLADDIAASKVRAAGLIDKILRPQRAFVAPVAPVVKLTPPVLRTAEDAGTVPAGEPAGRDDAGDAGDAGDNDYADSPWGPPPPIRIAAPAEPSLIPVMFSLSAETYADVMSGILKSRARLLRSKKLVEALEFIPGASADIETDDAIIEAVLAVLQRRSDVMRSGRNQLARTG